MVTPFPLSFSLREDCASWQNSTKKKCIEEWNQEFIINRHYADDRDTNKGPWPKIKRKKNKSKEQENMGSERQRRSDPHQYTTGISDSKGWQVPYLAANSRSLWCLKCEKSWDTHVCCRESAHKVAKSVSLRVWRLRGVEDGWEWKVLSTWDENLTSSSSTQLKKKYVERYV